jgi:hypothetical protein
MNWLNKLNERADRLINTMDENLQQPIADAMVFKPLHHQTLADNLSTSTTQDQPVEHNAPITGHPIRADQTNPVSSPRLKHA